MLITLLGVNVIKVGCYQNINHNLYLTLGCHYHAEQVCHTRLSQQI